MSVPREKKKILREKQDVDQGSRLGTFTRLVYIQEKKILISPVSMYKNEEWYLVEIFIASLHDFLSKP